MVVLLAGGAGYIGSHTAVELINAGHEVVIVDDYSNSCPESIKRVEEITGKSIVSYEADVKDKAALRKIFAENDIDCVDLRQLESLQDFQQSIIVTTLILLFRL